MQLLKKIKVAEVKIGSSNKIIKEDFVVETGVLVVECPYCKKYTNISYFSKNDDVSYYQKYCPHCGKKLVRENKKK